MGKKNSKLKQETVDQLISQTYCKKNINYIKAQSEQLSVLIYFSKYLKLNFLSFPAVTEKEIKQW